MTGCRTYSEFVELTNPYERHLIVESIDAYHRQREGAGGGGV
jgi:hypothetical protein